METERLDENALDDPVVRAIDISTQLFAGGSLDRGVERGAALLVRADRVGFVSDEAAPASDRLGEACQAGGPVVRRDHVLPGAESGSEVPWALLIPDESGTAFRWLVVERRRPAFSSSEMARVGALLRLSRTVAGDAGALEEAARTRVGPPRAVPRRPGSFRRTASPARP